MPRRRKRDQDGIFARPDSPFWWASFTDRRGRATRRSTGVRRDQDPGQLKAKAIRTQWILEAETDRGEAAQARVEGHSFDELMLMYLGQVSASKRAGERDQFSAKRLYPAFSGRVLETLGAADARAYVAQRTAEGAQPGTVNKEVGLMSAALNWARRELEWNVPNPFQGRRQREPAGRNRWLTRIEAQRLCAAAREGLRAPHLADFITRNGARIASVKKGFALAVQRARLEDVHPHDLRRTFGSWLVQAGVDIRRVSELMRHSDIRVTARVYAYLAPAHLAVAVEVLDRTLDGGTVSRPGFTLPGADDEGAPSDAITE